MIIPNWLHGYAATKSGATVRAALRAGDPIDVPSLGGEAEAYRERWENLQDVVNQGRLLPEVQPRLVDRTLIDDAQADSSAKGRVDLHDSLAALTELPGGAGEFFHELLSPAPDRERLRRLSAPFHGTVKFEADNMQSAATLHFEGGRDWPDALGGAWSTLR